jgi:carboxyl-terminal processing protease
VRTAGILLLTLLVLGAGMGLERFIVAESAVGSQQREELADLESFETLEQVYAYIREYYVLSDDISDEELIWGAASGMMDALGDEGHSYFLTPEEAEEQDEQDQGSFVGIGISSDDQVSPPRVVFPYEDSPAYEAGIRAEDVILTIDGKAYTEFETSRDFLDTIAGDAGTDVEIEGRHAGDVETYTVTITRAEIEIKTVSAAMLPDNVLWVRISAFERGTAADFERALRLGKRQGAESLVLDLRGNPGGWVDEQVAVSEQFFEPGTLVAQTKDAEGNITERETVAEEGEWRDQPVVVLINERSASSSEVVAAMIMDHERGISVGQRTFGTGTTVMPIDLPDDSRIWIGFDMWLTPDGTVVWHVGLEPTIEIANEPGTPLALPYEFDGELTEEELLATNDDQLLVGVTEVLDAEG